MLLCFFGILITWLNFHSKNVEFLSNSAILTADFAEILHVFLIARVRNCTKSCILKFHVNPNVNLLMSSLRPQVQEKKVLPFDKFAPFGSPTYDSVLLFGRVSLCKLLGPVPILAMVAKYCKKISLRFYIVHHRSTESESESRCQNDSDPSGLFSALRCTK